MADSTLQNGMTPGGADKNGMAVASLVLLYLQKVLRCFGKSVQLLPKGNWFPIVSVCICMAYCLIRNFIPWMQPLPV